MDMKNLEKKYLEKKRKIIVIDKSSGAIMFYTDGSGIRYEYEYTEEDFIFYKIGKYFKIKKIVIHKINDLTFKNKVNITQEMINKLKNWLNDIDNINPDLNEKYKPYELKFEAYH